MIKKEKNSLIVSLDAMGGDNAPEIVIEGASIYSKKNKKIKYIIHGDENYILPIINKFNNLKNKLEVVHTNKFILSDEKPSNAIRKGRDSSMGMAFQAVKDGKADCAVSAGNTGALMALSLFILRPMKGVKRPAICTTIPHSKGWSAVLDLGANLECSAENLVQFGVMGSVFYNIYKQDEKPSVGLLNIGTEEMKGREEIKQAGEILENIDIINYHGFVEGNDIGKGTTDVVVTDGFTGNITLKTIEGTATFIANTIKSEFKKPIFGLLAGIVGYPVFRKIKKKMNPELYNGAILLGLDGIAVKSHGSATAVGFANAIGVAVELAERNFIAKLKSELTKIKFSDLKDKV